MGEYSLELKNIKKSFTGEESVLQGISLSIAGGEFITLLGSSGCGKTTTLRMMLNMLSRDSGEVLWEGRPLDTDI